MYRSACGCALPRIGTCTTRIRITCSMVYTLHGICRLCGNVFPQGKGGVFRLQMPCSHVTMLQLLLVAQLLYKAVKSTAQHGWLQFSCTAIIAMLQVSIKRFQKRNLADEGMSQCMNALADEVEVPCNTVICMCTQ